ncbi:hypothetical protein NSP_37760 [Nodularia spumigena CCY9414]|nr:hypothetical protein NSP_37760 [Nodularia spumigena CCY9414]
MNAIAFWYGLWSAMFVLKSAIASLVVIIYSFPSNSKNISLSIPIS